MQRAAGQIDTGQIPVALVGKAAVRMPGDHRVDPGQGGDRAGGVFGLRVASVGSQTRMA